jgi:hypothetical protein
MFKNQFCVVYANILYPHVSFWMKITFYMTCVKKAKGVTYAYWSIKIYLFNTGYKKYYFFQKHMCKHRMFRCTYEILFQFF